MGIFSGVRFSACTVVGGAELQVAATGAEGALPPGTCRAGMALAFRADGDRVTASAAAPGPRFTARAWRLTSSSPISVTPEGGRGRSYRGELVIRARAGRLRLVNRVGLEDYLRGVLPAEVPASFHPEALKAQAIAARTFALANLGKHRAEGFDLCDTSHCQVYVGAGRADPRLEAAIQQTVGVILTYQGEPIQAVYCDTCGGRTAGNEDAWPGSRPLPYLRPVLDAEGGTVWCARSPRAVWSRRIPQRKLGDALSGLGVQGAVTAIEPAACDADGRPTRYQVRTEQGEWVINAGALRAAVNRALGASTLPSSDFKAAPNGDTLVFAGRGNGHGVGLCQWGANEMAKAGKTAEEILSHYYHGATLTRIYGSENVPGE